MPSVDGKNYPGPWEVRLSYTAVTSFGTTPHEMRVSMDVDSPPTPGSDFVDYDLQSRAGLFYNAKTWTDALVALLQPLFHPSATFQSAELWLYAAGSFNAAFQAAYSIGLNGSSAGAAVPMGQAIMTFRSQLGGSARVNLMESALAIGETIPYPTPTTNVNNLFDFFTDVDSPALARDGGYLFAPLNYLPGQNERLFKRYYRN